MQKFILPAICILAFGTLFAFAQQAAPQKAPVVQWEYQKLRSDNQKELNEMGKDGWELVAVVPFLISTLDRSQDKVTDHSLYFKRPKQ